MVADTNQGLHLLLVITVALVTLTALNAILTA